MHHFTLWDLGLWVNVVRLSDQPMIVYQPCSINCTDIFILISSLLFVSAGLGMLGNPAGPSTSSLDGLGFDLGSLPLSDSSLKNPLEALQSLPDQVANFKDAHANINFLEHIRRLKRIKQVDPGGGVPGVQNLLPRMQQFLTTERESDKNTKLRDLLLRSEASTTSDLGGGGPKALTGGPPCTSQASTSMPPQQQQLQQQSSVESSQVQPSPQPDPSPQLPQSTTSQDSLDHPDSSSPGSKDNKNPKENQNTILIQLLNQDEDSDEDEDSGTSANTKSRVSSSGIGASTATSTQANTPSTRTPHPSGDSSTSMEANDSKKNEAEAKKKNNNNVLLKVGISLLRAITNMSGFVKFTTHLSFAAIVE